MLFAASGNAVHDLGELLQSTKSMLAHSDQDRFIGLREVDHLNWVKSLSLTLLGAGKFEGQLDPSKCALGKWIYDSEAQSSIQDPQVRAIVREIEPVHQALHASASKILAATANGETQAAVGWFQQETLPALQATSSKLHSIRELYQGAVQRESESLLAEVTSGIWEQMGTGAAGFLAAATAQISSSSQSLAELSSRQAAAIEDTSSSAEEVRSMARANGENSRTAAELMSSSRRRFETANAALGESEQAMEEINEQSSRIARIIKVIDEIAFQTNILALNAAVEAARAGEAGMGFAVVADEVRNLAQRSAQAARDTTALIEESITKSQRGKETVDTVAFTIRQISEEVVRMESLVNEVSTGSQQQTTGIDHVSRAVSQLQLTTQITAADSEETASAASEISAQAGSMREVVHKLNQLVEG